MFTRSVPQMFLWGKLMALGIMTISHLMDFSAPVRLTKFTSLQIQSIMAGHLIPKAQT